MISYPEGLHDEITLRGYTEGYTDYTGFTFKGLTRELTNCDFLSYHVEIWHTASLKHLHNAFYTQQGKYWRIPASKRAYLSIFSPKNKYEYECLSVMMSMGMSVSQ